METKIGEFKGYQIVYDPKLRSFGAKNSDGEEVAKANTQNELEEKVAKIAKRSFSPIKAFRHEGNSIRDIEITSINPDERSAWFAYRGEKAKTYYGSGRGKLHLRSDRVFEATDHNKAIKVKVDDLNDQINTLEQQIADLKKQFDKPINLEHFGLKETWL